MSLFAKRGHSAYATADSLGAKSLSAVLAASRAVNSAHGLDESLHEVLANARDLLDAHEGSVMLLGRDGDLAIVSSEGIPPEVAAALRIKLGEGIAGKVAESGSAILIEGKSDPDLESLVPPDRPLISAISVPLKADGRTVGVLNLNLVNGRRIFDGDDLRIAQVFAEQAATAIHQAQLYEDARKRSEDAALLLEASRSLIGVLELEPLLTKVLDSGMKLVGARAGFMSLLDEPLKRLSLGVYQGVARHDIRELLARPGFIDLFKSETGSTFKIADSPVLSGIGDPEDHAVVISTRAEARTRALMLFIGDAPSPDRLQLCRMFTANVGLAIRNAQLYEQVGNKEAELSAIVHSIRNPVVVADDNGKLLVANPAAEHLFNFSSDFMKAEPIRGLLGHAKLESLLLGEKTGPIEVQAGNPEVRTWKAISSAINPPHGLPRGWVLVMDDVTTERETERLKADFVALVGHELRTPLTLIKGFIRTLIRRDDALTSELRREALTTADGQAHKLERLIEDLLYVSRIETSRPPLHLETVDLVETITELLDELKSREPDRPLSLIAPATLPITLDRVKIDQVVFHLLDNASKYSALTAPITIEITENPDEVQVSVIDKGSGILSTDIPGLFDIFHQVDSTSTREHGGTGVGLFICKSLVEAHGGRISLESIWGKGSIFRFTVPKKLEYKERKIGTKPREVDRETQPAVE